MSRSDARTLTGSLGALLIISGFAAVHCGGNDDTSARQNASTGGSNVNPTTSGGGGTDTTTTAGSGGGGMTGSGGSGQGGAGGTGATGPSPGTDVCPLPATTAMNPVLYDGVNGAAACGTTIKAPRTGFWFSYNDKSVDGGTPMSMNGEKGGCGGATDCALHTKGFGFTVYGAGVGFDINDNAQMMAQPVDLSAYMGIQFFAKGTATGTRGPKYASAANTIHVKFATMKDRGGDDYGGYCTITSEWSKCNIAFATATRDGFKDAMFPVMGDTLDANQMLKIQLEFSKFSDAADAGTVTPVAFDVWIDQVSLY